MFKYTKKITGHVLFALFGFLAFTNIFKLSYFEAFLNVGLAYNFYYLLNILLVLMEKDLKINENKKFLKDRLNFIMDSSKLFYSTFAIFSALILYLANIGKTDVWMSVIWLSLIIIAFQIPIIYLTLRLLYEKWVGARLLFSFMIVWGVLNSIFGWTSAWIAHDILKIPMYEDLTVATWGTLILMIYLHKTLKVLLPHKKQKLKKR